MGGDLLQRLAKKKGGVVVLIQNTTELTINTLSGSLTSGKPEKGAPMPIVIAALSQHEVGFFSPQGQWSFGIQGDSTYKTRLTILHDAEHANLERLPPEAKWTADLQQNWKADVPQIVITFMVREGAASSTPVKETKASTSPHKSEKSEDAPSTSSKRSKKASRELSEGKAKKDAVDEETSHKKRKAARKSKSETPQAQTETTPTKQAPAPSAEVSSSPPPAEPERPAPKAAFGIDAMMGGGGFDSDSDSDSTGGSGWGRKFVINQRPAPEIAATDNESERESIRRASMMFTVPGVKSTTGNSTEAASPAPADDDFFADLDANRSTKSLSDAQGERERQAAQIRPSAFEEYNAAIDALEQGKLAEAKTFMHAALSQLSELAFQSNAEVVTQWCIYAQLIGLLLEMERLMQEELFAQRALLARFVGLLGLRLENSAHALICMRLAVNRNLEMENFRTAAQLLTSLATMKDLLDLDRENMHLKQQICAQHVYSEAHIPTGATLDSVSGQFLINGASYVLCHKTMQLARDATHLFCPYCDATFAERSVPTRKCTFCDTSLQTQL